MTFVSAEDHSGRFYEHVQLHPLANHVSIALKGKHADKEVIISEKDIWIASGSQEFEHHQLPHWYSWAWSRPDDAVPIIRQHAHATRLG